MVVARRSLLRGAGAGLALGAVASATPQAAGAAPPARLAPARPLDGRPLPAYDFARANKLPREMSGYWEKAFTINGVRRTAKVYISPETPVRSYYTVLAAPDGTDTETFLWKTGWRELADRHEEGLFVLEPGPGGWGSVDAEAAYVRQAMSFYQSNGYFSIFGEHYLVGYDGGASALEGWAVEFPLRVIAQTYLRSAGLERSYLDRFSGREYDGTTEGGYTTVVLPPGFDKVTNAETVLPTWYIDPQDSARASLDYWAAANDVRGSRRDAALGTVRHQSSDSDRWMTSHAGPISVVAELDRPVSYWNRKLTADIRSFLTRYTRYENFFAYGNQLMERADYERLGVEVRTMVVDGDVREYLVHVPASASRQWGGRAPVLFVWPGNTQTDKVFFDASGWWEVAEREGFITVTVCEQYSASAISVSHTDSIAFLRQLREALIADYPVDPTRFYSTGQSAGSMVTTRFAITMPELFAAVASTSGLAAPGADGRVSFEGASIPASSAPIPSYLVYGYGDLGNLAGDLWDDTDNTLDDWAAYTLATHDLEPSSVTREAAVTHGYRDRFRTWTWSRGHGAADVPLVKVTKNLFRSHNMIPEEMPLLWEFLRHYSSEQQADGATVRWFSPSGFTVAGDRVRIM
jgi:hypothetical protein